MGHELIHVSQYAYLGSIGANVNFVNSPGFQELLDYQAYDYQNVLGGLKFTSFTSQQVRSFMNDYPSYFDKMKYYNFRWTTSVTFKLPPF